MSSSSNLQVPDLLTFNKYSFSKINYQHYYFFLANYSQFSYTTTKYRDNRKIFKKYGREISVYRSYRTKASRQPSLLVAKYKILSVLTRQGHLKPISLCYFHNNTLRKFCPCFLTVYLHLHSDCVTIHCEGQ